MFIKLAFIVFLLVALYIIEKVDKKQENENYDSIPKKEKV
jgi:large-conductance mechanosensitive channel